MRLYRMIGKDPDDYGFAEYHGDQPLNLSGLWRPATRTERIYHELFKHRFSYVDLVVILAIAATIAVLDLNPLLTLLAAGSVTLIGAGIVLFLEKRFR